MYQSIDPGCLVPGCLPCGGQRTKGLTRPRNSLKCFSLAPWSPAQVETHCFRGRVASSRADGAGVSPWTPRSWQPVPFQGRPLSCPAGGVASPRWDPLPVTWHLSFLWSVNGRFPSQYGLPGCVANVTDGSPIASRRLCHHLKG